MTLAGSSDEARCANMYGAVVRERAMMPNRIEVALGGYHFAPRYHHPP